MELKRFMYKKMLDWKTVRDMNNLHSPSRSTVLHLEGPRRSGKTYLAMKFGAECYKRILYIDMSIDRNVDFIKRYTDVLENLTGSDHWPRLFTAYDKSFVDSPDTLVIIDEVQNSSYMFSSISELRSCKFHCLMIGITFGLKGFYQPANDATRIEVSTLSFQEFLDNADELDKYNSLDFFGKSKPSWYDDIQRLYADYLVVGGYPDAVLLYLDSHKF
jgi:predicted AAA+ superfamily ATPase